MRRPPLRGNRLSSALRPASVPRSHRSRVGTLPSPLRGNRLSSALRSCLRSSFPPLTRGNAPLAAPRQPLVLPSVLPPFLVPTAPAWERSLRRSAATALSALRPASVPPSPPLTCGNAPLAAPRQPLVFRPPSCLRSSFPPLSRGRSPRRSAATALSSALRPASVPRSHRSRVGTLPLAAPRQPLVFRPPSCLRSSFPPLPRGNAPFAAPRQPLVFPPSAPASVPRSHRSRVGTLPSPLRGNRSRPSFPPRFVSHLVKSPHPARIRPNSNSLIEL